MLPINNLAEIKKSGNTTINMLVYGDSGVGKTTLAASAAELGKVLYIDAESGAKFIPDKYAKNIDILKTDNIAILDEVLKPENIKDYKVIVIDSITEVMKKMVDRVKGNKEKPSLADWGSVINGMETYFRKFRDLDKHIILVALSQEKGDEEMVLKRPSLSGKSLAADIVGIVDICLYMENTATGRIAYSQPSLKYFAKDRTNSLPEKLLGDDINMANVASLVLSQPEGIDEFQLAEIYSGIDKLKLDETAIGKMSEYGGAKTVEELSKKGADKVILAINKKLETFALEAKPEPVVEAPPTFTKEEEEMIANL